MKVTIGWFEKGFGDDATKAGGDFEVEMPAIPSRGDRVSFRVEPDGDRLDGRVDYVAWDFDAGLGVYVSVKDVEPFDDAPE